MYLNTNRINYYLSSQFLFTKYGQNGTFIPLPHAIRFAYRYAFITNRIRWIDSRLYIFYDVYYYLCLSVVLVSISISGRSCFFLRFEFTFNSFHCVANMSQRSKSFILSVNYMPCIQPAQPHPNTLDYHSNGLVCWCCCCFMLDLYSDYVAVHASKCWLFIALVYAQ